MQGIDQQGFFELYNHLRGGIAQLAEQAAHIRWVVGSIPSPAILFMKAPEMGLSLYLEYICAINFFLESRTGYTENGQGLLKVYIKFQYMRLLSQLPR